MHLLASTMSVSSNRTQRPMFPKPQSKKIRRKIESRSHTAKIKHKWMPVIFTAISFTRSRTMWISEASKFLGISCLLTPEKYDRSLVCKYTFHFISFIYFKLYTLLLYSLSLWSSHKFLWFWWWSCECAPTQPIIFFLSTSRQSDNTHWRIATTICFVDVS